MWLKLTKRRPRDDRVRQTVLVHFKQCVINCLLYVPTFQNKPCNL